MANSLGDMMADSPVKVNTPGEAPAGPSPEEQKKMGQHTIR